MNILLIFIRNPVLGAVKTRLAHTVGPERALEIYEFLLDKTRQTALGTKAARWLFYTENEEQMGAWDGHYFEKKRQSEGDLGERMGAAFAEAFRQNRDARVVIIGSDCPDLTPDLLEKAFEALNSFNFVIGPVLDGGYYLLGMRRMEPSVFSGIDWSTERVFEQTVARIEALGCTYQTLPQLRDIDTEADWIEYAARQAGEKRV